MSDQKLDQELETLSALVDGELDGAGRETAINLLLKDSAARQRWQRHHLISDALRRNLPHAIDKDFSSRIMRALQDEPTILAPRRRTTGGFGRRIAGLAVAASVAAMGVLGVQFMYQHDALAPPQDQIAQLPANKSGTGMASTGAVQLVEQKAPLRLDPRVQQNLAKYLLDHNRQTARSVQGVVPYARIVTYPNTSTSQGKVQDRQ